MKKYNFLSGDQYIKKIQRHIFNLMFGTDQVWTASVGQGRF
jgi:hypothetical protein